jgi:hypothetical protein
MVSPSDLNTVARLVMIAERCGPDFLDNAESFDRVLGRGSFAQLDREILNKARAVTEPRRAGSTPADTLGRL